MKKTICYIFAFFLSFFLFLLTLFTITRFSIFGESYLFARLNQTDYYENAVEQYNRVLKQNTRPTNLPIELFDNYVKTVDVMDDMKTYIDVGFQGETYTIDISSFQMKMTQTIDTYVNEHQLAIDATTQKAIDSFINANVVNYEKLIAFPYFEYISKGIVIVHKAFLIIAPVLFLLCLLMVFIQLRLHKSRRRKKRWLAYSFIGNGLLLLVCPSLLLGFKVFHRIQLEPQYLYSLINSIMNRYCILLIVAGFISILFGVFLTYFKKKDKKSKHRIKRNYDHSVQFNSIAKE